MPFKILLALGLSTSIAHAANWQSLITSKDGSIALFVDTTTTEADGALRWASIRGVYAPSTKMTASGKWIDHEEIRYAFNCQTQQLRIEAMTFYYPDGTHETALTRQAPSQWITATPDSVGKLLIKPFCTRIRK